MQKEGVDKGKMQNSRRGNLLMQKKHVVENIICKTPEVDKYIKKCVSKKQVT